MTYKTLFSGRAGDFAENLPKNSHGHVVFFDSSVANGHETFARKMSHAKNVKTDLLRGGHLTLMAREMVYRSLARMVEARNEFNTHGNSTKMYDLEKIIAAQPSHLPKIRRSKKQSVA